jgi:hypothetical protein
MTRNNDIYSSLAAVGKMEENPSSESPPPLSSLNMFLSFFYFLVSFSYSFLSPKGAQSGGNELRK